MFSSDGIQQTTHFEPCELLLHNNKQITVSDKKKQTLYLEDFQRQQQVKMIFHKTGRQNNGFIRMFTFSANSNKPNIGRKSPTNTGEHDNN